MINRVVLVGRLTKDPEYRVTPSGVSVATFTLAINRNFTNAQGERQADYLNCVVFKKQAENVNNYLKKGSLAGVDGRLQSRSYENSEGRKVYVVEVVCDSVQFLEPKKDGQQNKQQPQSNPFANQSQQNNDYSQYNPGFGGQAQQYQAQPQQQYQAPPQQNHYNNPAPSDFDSDNPPF